MPDDSSEAFNDAWFRARDAAEEWRRAKRVLAGCGVRMMDALRELTPAQQSRFYREHLAVILAENPFEAEQ